MLTTITARHDDIPDDLKARAELVVARLAQRVHRPTSARVTFDTEPRPSAEIVMNAARDVVHVARAEADDHRSALDRVAAKLRRQFDKHDPHPKGRKSRRAAARAAAR